MVIASIFLKTVNHEEACRTLEQILSRREFQGWVNPIEILRSIMEKLSSYFTDLPPYLQTILIVILVAILAAMLIHWIIVLVRVIARGGPGVEKKAGEGGIESLFRTKKSAGEIREEALAHLKKGNTREAIRLLYVYFVLRLRDRGVIPRLESLTAREITLLVREKTEGADQAGALFEKSAYSHHPLDRSDADWMLRFVESSRGD
ncbi:MAG: DUF4129 domain-containing protein [Pseudomonadota bacterium]